MRIPNPILLGLCVATACATKDRATVAGADSLSRDLQLAPADSTRPLNDRPEASPGPAPSAAPQAGPTAKRPSVPRPAAERKAREAAPAAATPAVPAAPVELTLAAGATIPAALDDSINSRSMKAGTSVTAHVSSDVTDAAGHVVIPAGSAVHLTVTTLAPATSRSQADGKIAMHVDDVVVRGVRQGIAAEVGPVPHELHGRGVSAGEVEKVGVGTAIGAIAGRVIGGNGKGAIIGGVVGAAGGTAVAAQTASRDVVVRPGAAITITLTGPVTVSR